MRLKLFLLLTLVSITYLPAQTDSTNTHIRWDWNKLSVSGTYIQGKVMPTNIFVRGSNSSSVVIDDYQLFSLRLSTQTTGKHLWEQLCNYPTWGIALSALDFYDPSEIGIPITVNGFFVAPFFRLNKLSLNYDLGFGVTFNWKSYNPLTNKYNVAIGAGEAFMSTAGLNLEYALTDHIDISGGASFSHFSNGAIKLPNFGINAIAPKVSLKYNFYERPKFIKHEIPKFDTKSEWVISAFAGIKNVIYDSLDVAISEKYEGMFFPVYGFSALFNRQISYYSKIGIGMTINYNESINTQVAVDKISIVLQPAFYILRKNTKNQSPVFHQRIMLKYHITDQIFAGITLRDYSIHADFVEWTLGYRISK